MRLFKKRARGSRARSFMKSRNVRPVDMAAILAENDGYSRSWEGFYITSNGMVLSVREWSETSWDDENECDFAGGVYYDIPFEDGGDGGIMDYRKTAVMGDFNEFQRDQSGGDIVGMIQFPNKDVEYEFSDAFDEAQEGIPGAYDRMHAVAKQYGLYNRRPRA